MRRLALFLLVVALCAACGGGDVAGSDYEPGEYPQFDDPPPAAPAADADSCNRAWWNGYMHIVHQKAVDPEMELSSEEVDEVLFLTLDECETAERWFDASEPYGDTFDPTADRVHDWDLDWVCDMRRANRVKPVCRDARARGIIELEASP